MVNMRVPLIRILKFTGTVSLGLLTGLSYTLSTLTYPSLLHLPTAPSASQASSILRQKTTTIQRTLSTLAGACLITAFALSPRRTAHPYLLWTSALAFIGANAKLEWFFARRLDYRSKVAMQREHGQQNNEEGLTVPLKQRQEEVEMLAESAVLVNGSSSSNSGESDGEGSATAAAEQARINGEVVRRALERGMLVEWGRTVVEGVAFTMAVIGLWGDGA